MDKGEENNKAWQAEDEGFPEADEALPPLEEDDDSGSTQDGEYGSDKIEDNCSSEKKNYRSSRHVKKLELFVENGLVPVLSEGEEVRVSSVSKYLACLEKIANMDKAVFRGSKDRDYEFEPSLLRKGMKKEKEPDYYQRIIQREPGEFLNRSAFDILCKMQHYGLPTRLLDLTDNPLTALWFACAEDNGKKALKDGKVEIITGRFHRSDMHAIQIICLYADFLSSHSAESYGDLNLDDFRDYLNQKQTWCGGDDYVDYLCTILSLEFIGIRPEYSNPRIKAQQGLFVLFGIGHDPRQDVSIQLQTEGKEIPFPVNKPHPGTVKKSNIQEIIIPKNNKDNILKTLNKIDFNKPRFFPELEKTSEYVKEFF